MVTEKVQFPSVVRVAAYACRLRPEEVDDSLAHRWVHQQASPLAGRSRQVINQ